MSCGTLKLYEHRVTFYMSFFIRKRKSAKSKGNICSRSRLNTLYSAAMAVHGMYTATVRKERSKTTVIRIRQCQQTLHRM